MNTELLDMINSVFFFSSSVFVMLNVIKLVQDKEIKGVRLLPGLFFSISTIWGIYYYGQLLQYISLIGIAFLAIANTLWIALAVYYVMRNKRLVQ